MKSITPLFLFLLVFSCGKNDPVPEKELYFPPVGAGTWQSVTPASLGWNESKIPDLDAFLVSSNTRALIVLKDGKIVIEKYLGTQLTAGAFTASSNWYWASAGKTLTSATTGIAVGEGQINLNAKTSEYLGTGWTSLTLAQENNITVRHQLTMTSGLDDYSEVGDTGNKDCTDPACLIYKADAGTRWAYHNGPYTLLDDVISNATGTTLNAYVKAKILDKIGMDGSYLKVDLNNIFFSTPRSMARFGLLLLNKGNWNGQEIIPLSYFNQMIEPSQSYNLSYGYLTWLNGKASFMTPGSQARFPTELTPNAPNEMFAAMGKDGQIINIVPSQGLVVIRMGESTGGLLVPFTFQNDLWDKLNDIIVE